MSTLLYLLLGALAGWLATRLPPGRAPYELTVTAPAAIVGAVLLSLPLGDQGPDLARVAVAPAAAGALLGAGALHLMLARLLLHDGDAAHPTRPSEPAGHESARPQ